MIKNPDVASHYRSHEVSSFDPWSLLGAVRCPVLVLAGEDDPISPAARGRGTSQPAAGGNHPLRASSRSASHHLPRPPGPRFPGREELRLPGLGKPARKLLTHRDHDRSPRCPAIPSGPIRALLNYPDNASSRWSGKSVPCTPRFWLRAGWRFGAGRGHRSGIQGLAWKARVRASRALMPWRAAVAR